MSLVYYLHEVMENNVCYHNYCLFPGILVDDEVPLVVFGVAKVKRLRIMAQLSGLKLEAELQNGQTSITHREKVRGLQLLCNLC